jgi:hypothetical protein
LVKNPVDQNFFTRLPIEKHMPTLLNAPVAKPNSITSPTEQRIHRDVLAAAHKFEDVSDGLFRTPLIDGVIGNPFEVYLCQFGKFVPRHRSDLPGGK